MTPPRPGRVVCWGRGDRAYSRDAVLRTCFESLDFEVTDFRPRTGMSAGLEAVLALRGPVDLVWVPAFRHRDLAGAARWCRRRGVPLLFDPLISTYDKQVAERRKYAPESAFARRLLAWERSRMTLADVVLADTRAHARYFSDILGVPDERLHVVPVGVDETLFQPKPSSASDGPLELLFYGSFLALQGPRVIVDAARLGADQPLRWSLLGEGPLLAECREAERAGRYPLRAVDRLLGPAGACRRGRRRAGDLWRDGQGGTRGAQQGPSGAGLRATGDHPCERCLPAGSRRQRAQWPVLGASR